MGKTKATIETEDVGVNWLECELCSGWEIYENTGFTGPFSSSVAKKSTYVCRFCNLNSKFEELLNQVKKVETMINAAPKGPSWSDVVKQNDLQTTKDEMNKLLSDNCNSIKEELNSIKVNVTTTSSNPASTLSATQLHQTTTELMDVESRKLSLVIFGLPEKGNDLPDLLDFINMHHEVQKIRQNIALFRKPKNY